MTEKTKPQEYCETCHDAGVTLVPSYTGYGLHYEPCEDCRHFRDRQLRHCSRYYEKQ